jgi:hypothetical protein
MIPLNYPSSILSANALRPGAVLRELSLRQDRVPVDERVDLPEIQESFRVNFSDEARASGSGGLGNEAYRPPPGGANPETERKLQIYAQIAGL